MPETPTLRTAIRQFLRLVGLIKPYWRALTKSMILGLVFSAVSMTTPYFSKLLIDEVYPSHDLTFMHVLVAGILAVSVVSAIMKGIQGYYTLYVSARLNNAIGLLFFNHLQHLKVKFFDTHQVGEITSRFQDVRNSLNTVTNWFQTLFSNAVYLLLVPPFLLILEWKLALLALMTIPLSVVVVTALGRIVRHYWKRTSEAYAELSAFQVEVLSHIRTFKTMALEHFIFGKAGKHINEALTLQLKAGGFGQLIGSINGLLYALNTTAFTWFGWTLILSQEMTLGDYIAFTAYLGYLYNPLTQFVNLLSEFQQATVSLGRMFEYLDTPAEQNPLLVYSSPSPIRFHLKGNFRIQSVSFGYTTNQRVLCDINLNITNGAITAIVGPSGSGKTSLLRLLMRMEEPDSGRIFIDGIALAQIPLPDLRRQISVVWQEVSLIQGSVWENLTLGSENSCREIVNEAIHLCRLDELFTNLPKGFETTIAEWGASLSAGQRQRLAMARALIRDTPVLILDEATSNIDVQTETEILHDFFSQLKGKTIIFVTHRLASASLADQVCVLETGQVAGVGTHHELLSNNMRYRQMHGMPSVVREDHHLRMAQPG
jgi:ABC-type bacteriocin/lantibiotic exporter with double-glycine peptidase domain